MSRPATPSKQVGTTIQNLYLESILGQGTFACLYVGIPAVDQHTVSGASSVPPRKYAVKCMRKHEVPQSNTPYSSSAGRDKSAPPSWQEEVNVNLKLMSSLGDNGATPSPIVPMLDWFEHEEHVYLVFDWAAHGDLFAHLQKRNYAFDDAETRRLFLQILDAVEYCHSRGIYHRDLKPENILIQEMCGGGGEQEAAPLQLRLCDFGLATQSRMSLRHGVGTELYMSPEAYDRKSEEAHSSEYLDVWSLVILLFNLRFGGHPWSVANESEDPDYAAFLQNPFTLGERHPVSFELVHLLRKVCIDRSITTVRGLREAVLECSYLATGDVPVVVSSEFWASEEDTWCEEDEYSPTEYDSYSAEEPMFRFDEQQQMRNTPTKVNTSELLGGKMASMTVHSPFSETSSSGSTKFSWADETELEDDEYFKRPFSFEEEAPPSGEKQQPPLKKITIKLTRAIRDCA